MKVVLSFVLLHALASGMRRGPHHPQGTGSNRNKHHHYKPKGGESLTAETQVLHDIKHLEEDFRALTSEALASLSLEELEFYYFSAHDFDGNSMLDGLELLKSLYHTADHGDTDTDSEFSIEHEDNDIENYKDLVDRTLESDDIDGDGFVSYAEYRSARVRNPTKRTSSVIPASR